MGYKESITPILTIFINQSSLTEIINSNNKNRFPMLDIPYENRNGYYTALERSQIKQDEKIFLQWFFKRYLKEYKRFI